MHEMTIAVGLIDLAVAQAREAEARRINRLEVVVGGLAGVEIPALTFCYETARRGTLCADAELQIEYVPGRGRCPACDAESDMDFQVAVCPACGAIGLEILQGRELRLRALNVD